MTHLTRRSFFAKLAGAAVAVHAAPSLPVWGSTGGAQIGSITGGFAGVDLASGKDFSAVAVYSKGQIAEWFNVPPVLIADAPTFSAPDPFDSRDLICCNGGKWYLLQHTDPCERRPLKPDTAMRILGIGGRDV